MLKRCFENVKNKSPLIHNITNYVTVNDCANILLACGGSPIMADYSGEIEEIASICNGLNINIGTLNEGTMLSMILAGKKSNKCNNPVLLDPVGAGASALRTETAQRLLEEVEFSVIRGNISEIKTLINGTGSTSGVDASIDDVVTEANLDETVSFAKSFSAKTGAVIVITGAIDIVADSEKAYVIRNGHPMMSKITGTGCMLSAMTTAFIAANPENIIEATKASVAAMGLCGELAFERLSERDGNSTYRNYLIDEVCNLTAEKLESGARYEVR